MPNDPQEPILFLRLPMAAFARWVWNEETLGVLQVPFLTNTLFVTMFPNGNLLSVSLLPGAMSALL